MTRSLVLLALALVSGSVLTPTGAHAGLNPLSVPRGWVDTARTNIRDGQFLATDRTVHPSRGAALRRSLAPSDVGANVRATVARRFYPATLAGALFAPLSLLVQRGLAGEGLDAETLKTALNPGAIVGGWAGGTVGGIAGSAAHSVLSKLGPGGAVAGLAIRPAISIFSSLIGITFGSEIGSGNGNIRDALATGIEEIAPTRDAGLAIGGLLGGAIGQALIPVFPLGSILGGAVGGWIGGMIGNLLPKVPGFRELDQIMRKGLGALASWIRGRPPRKPEDGVHLAGLTAGVAPAIRESAGSSD